MIWQNFIDIDNNILSDKPVIKNTRILVDFIINLFASGWTHQQFLDNYPKLTYESFIAVFAKCLADEKRYPVCPVVLFSRQKFFSFHNFFNISEDIHETIEYNYNG
ncbi:MAG: DUF433 domain-containing protein [Candidatus Magnetomorum sp.]|nr:DUF433 domain-containing protein [Candidatus Magnetomorum sp.]